MSARKVVVRLSREADQDLQDLLLYTRRTWGEAQKVTYRTAIIRTLRLLRDYPHSGQPRMDLFPGCRGVQVEQHVIYYHLPRAGDVEVLRILHRRQDPTGNVEQPTT